MKEAGTSLLWSDYPIRRATPTSKFSPALRVFFQGTLERITLPLFTSLVGLEQRQTETTVIWLGPVKASR
jgi:hypothetical protein